MLNRFLGTAAICCLPLCAAPVLAEGFTSTIQDAVGISVQGAAIQTSRVGTTYAVSGVNVSSTGAIGLSAGTAASATAAAVPAPNAFSVSTGATQFSFSENLIVGDTAITTQAVSGGQIATPTTYGNSTTQLGGDKGTLGATLTTTTGAMSITAGGPGTSATMGRTVTLTAF